jgi:hypothetical protein
VRENVFAGQTPFLSQYPTGNFYPSNNASIGYSSAIGGDYSLAPVSSSYQGAFGRVGIDRTALLTKTSGVVR